MISPTKHLGLESCTLRVAATVLQHLLGGGVESAVFLSGLIERELGPDACANLAPALTFLFALGLVDYVDEIDAFQLTRTRVAA